MKSVMGIDPGLSGGIAVFDGMGPLVEVMPNVDGVLDLNMLASYIKIHKPDVCYLEKVHSMPGQGVSSVFKFGRVFGVIEGMLAALSIPYVLVTPQKWMKTMHEGVEGSLDTKARSRIAASRLFPGLDLKASARCRNTHEGMVEALLIAEYGRRQQ